MDLSDSEYDSDDQDEEFRLYANLYFGEANQTKLCDESSLSSKNVIERQSNSISETPYCKKSSSFGISKRCASNIKDSINDGQPRCPVSKSIDAYNNDSINTKDGIEEENASNIKESSNAGQPTSALGKSIDHHNNNSTNKCERNYNENRMKKTTNRNSSECSVEILSGKAPLDNLYCIVSGSDENWESDEVQILPPEKKKKSRVSKPKAMNRFTDSKCALMMNNQKTSVNGKIKSTSKMKLITPLLYLSSDSENGYVSPSSSIFVDTVRVSPDSSDSENFVRALQSSSKSVKGSSDQIISCVVREGQKLPTKRTMTGLNNDSDDSAVGRPENSYLTTVYFKINNPTMSRSVSLPSKMDKSKLSKIGRVKSMIIFNEGRKLSKKTSSCKLWTPEMSSFYDSDVPGELFVEDVHAMQSDSPRKWNICSEDSMKIFSTRRYFNAGKRCTRCREYDHVVKDCRKIPVCVLCSSDKHTNIRVCPSNCCLKCGALHHGTCHKISRNQLCNVCKTYGHISELCPDLWRRFHYTKSGNSPVIPPKIKLKKKEPFCSNCVRKGHYVYQCREGNASKYVASSRDIYSYSVVSNQNISSTTSGQLTSKQKKQKTVSTKKLTIKEKSKQQKRKLISNKQKKSRQPNLDSESVSSFTKLERQFIKSQKNITNKFLRSWKPGKKKKENSKKNTDVPKRPSKGGYSQFDLRSKLIRRLKPKKKKKSKDKKINIDLTKSKKKKRKSSNKLSWQNFYTF